MSITKEELAQELDVSYIKYCTSNSDKKVIVSCHTNLFKRVGTSQVRYFSYWWLRYKYGMTSYFQDHKIPDDLISDINTALTKTVQKGYRRDSLCINLIEVFEKYSEHYENIYNEHLKQQADYNKLISEYAEKDIKDWITIIVLLTLIVSILIWIY